MLIYNYPSQILVIDYVVWFDLFMEIIQIWQRKSWRWFIRSLGWFLESINTSHPPPLLSLISTQKREEKKEEVVRVLWREQV